MATTINIATGLDIVVIQGPQFSYVGTWTAGDIDQHISDNPDRSPADVAKAWILGLFADQKGKGEFGLNADDIRNGTNAMLWYLVCEYLEASQVGESCPDGCKTQAQLNAQKEYAKSRVCKFLDLAGLTDASICDYVDGGGILQGMTSAVYYSCENQ